MKKTKTFYGKVEGGKIKCGAELDLYIGFLEGKEIMIEIGQRRQYRTQQQNNSLHLLFKLLSDEMTEKGLDFKIFFNRAQSVEPTPEMIKYIWKKIQKATIREESTTRLNKIGDIERVYDNFNRMLVEIYKGEVVLPPFPSLENMPPHNI